MRIRGGVGSTFDVHPVFLPGGGEQLVQLSTFLPAFFQPWMPAGITNTFSYPSFSAATAAVWQACQCGLAQ
jgi:hypothetical protein